MAESAMKGAMVYGGSITHTCACVFARTHTPTAHARAHTHTQHNTHAPRTHRHVYSATLPAFAGLFGDGLAQLVQLGVLRRTLPATIGPFFNDAAADTAWAWTRGALRDEVRRRVSRSLSHTRVYRVSPVTARAQRCAHTRRGKSAHRMPHSPGKPRPPVPPAASAAARSAAAEANASAAVTAAAEAAES
jgi:hypothetical protein